MKLSKYGDEIESKWAKEEKTKVGQLIEYINGKIDKDLFEIAKTNDSVQVFNKLKLWLFVFYNKELQEGLEIIGYDKEKYKKSLIYSLILGVTRDSSTVERVYDSLKEKGVIEKMMIYDDGTYEIFTKDFGNISFKKADENFERDEDALKHVKNLGDSAKEKCHAIALYLIAGHDKFKAVTAECKNGLDHSYFHSFVLDEEENVIDFTGNVIMPKKDYYMIQDLKELNCVDYAKYLKEKDKSIQYDESKTLYGLLRNTLYNEYVKEEQSR